MTAKPPLTILSGFLGAGKTTILNRVLAHPGGRRIAVLVNELGRVSIDTQRILSRGGDAPELAGGCVCCKIDVKNDLWDGIADVVRRSRPDALVLETTGIAEPQAILEGLTRHESAVMVQSVVCVIDADDGGAALDRRDEAKSQLECADGVLLSKLDIASAEQAQKTHARILAINPGAERVSFPDDDAGNPALTGWLLARRFQGGKSVAHNHRHSQVNAVVYQGPEPLLEQPLLAVVDEFKDRLLRIKGFVHLAGENRRGFLELAGKRVDLTLGDNWEGARQNQIVFIGEDLDEAALHRRLWACRAGRYNSSL